MRAFWAAGYDGASVDRLCREMQMPRASLYQSFGDKRGLFLAAIEHYVATRIAPLADALGPHGTLEQDLGRFYESVIALATGDEATPGCLISCVLSDAAGADRDLRAELDRRLAGLEQRIEARLRIAGAPAPAAAAGMAAAVARGLMLRARAGAAPGELAPVADAAVQSLLRLAR